MTNTTSNAKSYFDLHTEGYGRLQRVREVPVRGGRRAQPFLACTVAAFVGSTKDPVTRYFDVKVSGAEAKKLVERYNERRTEVAEEEEPELEVEEKAAEEQHPGQKRLDFF